MVVLSPRKVYPENQQIGRLLRSVRIERGIKAEQMAERLAMSAENYRHYEAGRNKLSALDLPRFANALGISAQALTDRLQITGAPAQPEQPPGPTTHAMTELYEFFRSNPDLTDAATDLALFTTGQPLSDEGVRAIIYTYKAVKAMEAAERRPRDTHEESR